MSQLWRGLRASLSKCGECGEADCIKDGNCQNHNFYLKDGVCTLCDHSKGEMFATQDTVAALALQITCQIVNDCSPSGVIDKVPSEHYNHNADLCIKSRECLNNQFDKNGRCMECGNALTTERYEDLRVSTECSTWTCTYPTMGVKYFPEAGEANSGKEICIKDATCPAHSNFIANGTCHPPCTSSLVSLSTDALLNQEISCLVNSCTKGAKSIIPQNLPNSGGVVCILDASCINTEFYVNGGRICSPCPSTSTLTVGTYSEISRISSIECLSTDYCEHPEIGIKYKIEEGEINENKYICIKDGECPGGYIESNTCNECRDTGCEKCRGDGEEMCTECVGDYYATSVTPPFSCSLCTDIGDYKSSRGSNVGGTCLKCHSTCEECAAPNSQFNCTRCVGDSNMFLGTSDTILDHALTSFPCGLCTTRVIATTNHPAIQNNHPFCLLDDLCPLGWEYILTDNECLSPVLGCDPNCSICGNYTKCKICSTNYFLLLENSIQFLPDGFYTCAHSCPAPARRFLHLNRKFCITDGTCPTNFVKWETRKCKHCERTACQNEGIISQVTPKLCQDGIMVREEESTALDGSCSYGDHLDSGSISVEWKCYKDEGLNKKCGIEEQTIISPKYSPGTLPPGDYYFKLIFRKGNYHKSRVFDVKVISSGPIIRVTLSSGEELPAIWDSQTKYILKFTSKRKSTEFTYNITPSVPTSFSTSEYLKFPSSSLEEGTSYTLKVRGTNKEGESVTQRIKIEVGGTVLVGSIAVAPLTGISFDTLFTVKVDGWRNSEDSNAELEYKYLYQIKGSPPISLSNWVSTTQYITQLPPGPKTQSHTLSLLVRARNSGGWGMNSGTINLKVSSPILADKTEESEYIHNILHNGKGEKPAHRLRSLTQTTLLFQNWNSEDTGEDLIYLEKVGVCGGCVHGTCDVVTRRCICQPNWKAHPKCSISDQHAQEQNGVIQTFLEGILYIYIYI